MHAHGHECLSRRPFVRRCISTLEFVSKGACLAALVRGSNSIAVTATMRSAFIVVADASTSTFQRLLCAEYKSSVCALLAQAVVEMLLLSLMTANDRHAVARTLRITT